MPVLRIHARLGVVMAAVTSLSLTLLGLSPGVAHAGVPGTIAGVVTDAGTGKPVVGARVTDPDDATVSAYTDATGAYSLPASPGTHHVGASAQGYEDGYYLGATGSTPADIQVADGATVPNIDIALRAYGTVTGFVLADDTNQGVAGVVTKLYSTDQTRSDPVATATTDADGSFTVSAPAGDYTLQYDASQTVYLSRWWPDAATRGDATTITVAAGETVTDRSATLLRGATVRGVVLDQDGNPLPNVPVRAMADIGNTSSQVGTEPFTDADGGYTVTGLVAGTYTLYFGTDGVHVGRFYGQTTAQEGAETFSVPEASDVTARDMVLPVGGTISGHIAAPAGTTSLWACVTGLGCRNADASGDYTIPAVDTGTWLVSFGGLLEDGSRLVDQYWKDQADSFNATPVKVVAGQPTTGIDQTLTASTTTPQTATAHIVGTLVDQTGQPLPAVYVFASSVTDAPGMWSAVTDAQGRFDLLAPAGDYTLGQWDTTDGLRVPDSARYVGHDGTVVHATNGTPLDIGTYTVAAPGGLTGTVTNRETGKAVPDAVVYIVPVGDDVGTEEDFNIWWNPRVTTTRTDSTGHYLLDGLAPGIYSVRVAPAASSGLAARWYPDAAKQANAGTVVVTSRTSQRTDVRVSRTGNVSGTVVDGANNALRGVTVRAWRAGADGPIFVTTDANGQYTLGGLVPGSYTLEFSGGPVKDAWWPGVAKDAAKPVTITAGQALSGYDMSLDAIQPVTGTVTGPDGPVENAHVGLTPPGGDSTLTAEVLTDSSGRFLIYPDAAGSYSLSATADGLTSGTASVSVALNTATPVVHAFALAREAVITGTLTAPDGTHPEITAVDETGTSYRGEVDEQGGYRIGRLPAGNYVVRTGGSLLADVWYPAAADRAAATPLTVAAGEEKTGIDLTTGYGNAGTITVTALVNGKPAADRSINVTSVDADLARAITDASGVAVLHVSPGTYLAFTYGETDYLWYPNASKFYDADPLTVSAGHDTAITMSWTEAEAPTSPDPTFSDLTGRIDAGASMPSGASFSLYAEGERSAGEVSVGATGEFFIEGIADGKYTLTLHEASGQFADLVQTVTLPLSAPLVLTPVRRPQGVISGSVVTSAKAPIGATVTAIDAAGVLHSDTTANGQFTLRGVSDGVAKLSVAVKQPYRGATYLDKTVQVTVTGGTAAVQDIQVELGGSISGTAALHGVGYGPVKVEAVDAAGTVVAGVTSDWDGFLLAPLPAGKVWLRASAVGYPTVWWPAASSQSAATPVNVVAGQKSDAISFTLYPAATPTGTISGTLTTKGAAAVGAWVRLMPTGDGEWIYATADAAGHYIATVPVGSYQLAAATCIAWTYEGGGGICEWRYYPNATDTDQATAIKVAAGEAVTGRDIEFAAATSAAKTFTATPTPSINGSAVVGQKLRVAAPSWTPSGATFAYQWLRAGAPIAGATTASYALTADDLGATVSVQVTGRLSGYTTTTITSAATAAVTAGSLTTGSVTISGQPVTDRALTASTSGWPAGAALTYQWRVAGVAQTGATTASFTPVAGDVGKTVTVTVTGSLFGYAPRTVSSAATAPVLAPMVNTALPVVSGTARTGLTLTAATGTWTPSGASFAYQWLRDGAAITGATAPSYTLVSADFAHVVTVRVTAAKTGVASASAISANTAAVAAGSFTAAPTPTISGDLSVGSTLTAKPGTWGPGTVTLTYQWYRSGTAISGATATTYKLTSAELGRAMTVRVTGSETGFTAVNKVSSATAAVLKGFTSAPTPTISGTAKVNLTLTAKPGTWGPGTVTLKYQWYRSGAAISGATASTYKLTGTDYKAVITVRVTGSEAGYLTLTKASAGTAAVAVGTLTAAPTPTVAGTAKVGYTLTAKPGTWSPAPVTLSYQWYRSGTAISTAHSATYKLTSTDKGKRITVKVTGTKVGYTTVARISAATAAVG